MGGGASGAGAPAIGPWRPRRRGARGRWARAGWVCEAPKASSKEASSPSEQSTTTPASRKAR
eukprot:11535356-Alexandrium_andersonii.AAC.1